MPAASAEKAPAKVNLTLHVVRRRSDGYHDIESLVVFADLADELTFTPGSAFALTVDGPTAAAAGDGRVSPGLRPAGPDARPG